MAGDKPLAAFLRDLANGVEQAPVPVNELEALRNSVLRKIEELRQDIKGLDETWWQSFMKHEKDILAQTIRQTLTLLLLRHPELDPDEILPQFDSILNEQWSEHLTKNGMVERDGRIDRIGEDRG